MEEVLFGRIRMTIPDAQFRVSTDSMVLADFCTLPPRSAICDLGCGCGSLSLLLCGKYPQAQLTGMELQEEAAALAQENAVQNSLSDRLRILCGDLREHRTLLPHSSFDAVVSNPPYYPAGSGGVSDFPALAAALGAGQYPVKTPGHGTMNCMAKWLDAEKQTAPIWLAFDFD